MRERMERACAPACHSSGLALAQRDVLFMPGTPSDTSGYFRVSTNPINISAYGLCDGDELVIEQIELQNGCPGYRHGCCIRDEGDVTVAFAWPFMSGCNPVTLNECQTRLIIDQVGTYRLKLIPGPGKCTPCSLGELFVKKTDETVTTNITDEMRGFFGGGGSAQQRFIDLVGMLGALNDTQRQVIKAMLDLNIDVDAVVCALDENDNASAVLKSILSKTI